MKQVIPCIYAFGMRCYVLLTRYFRSLYLLEILNVRFKFRKWLKFFFLKILQIYGEFPSLSLYKAKFCQQIYDLYDLRSLKD